MASAPFGLGRGLLVRVMRFGPSATLPGRPPHRWGDSSRGSNGERVASRSDWNAPPGCTALVAGLRRRWTVSSAPMSADNGVRAEVASATSRSRRRQTGWDQGRWRPDAACAGMGTDLFFPVGESADEAIQQIRCARAICGRCPVRLHCLVYALVTNQEEGDLGRLYPERASRSAPPAAPSTTGGGLTTSAVPEFVLVQARILRKGRSYDVGRCTRRGAGPG